MKTFTKKIMISIIAVAFAFIALGTSTFAWFAMNTQVTATGMEVSVKSNNTYLMIGKENTAANIQDNDETSTVAITFQNTEVLPSAPALSAAEAAYLPVQTYYGNGDQIPEGKQIGDVKVAGLKDDNQTAITVAGAQVTDKDSVALVTNWYTAIAATVDAPDMKAGSARQLSSFTGYVLIDTVYLTVAEGANDAHNLKVTPTITQKSGGTDVSEIKVIVATVDKMVVLDNSDNNTAIDLFDASHNTAIVDDDVLEVKIYVYYDGNADPVFTNNRVNLKGADIELAFTVDPIED